MQDATTSMFFFEKIICYLIVIGYKHKRQIPLKVAND
jgi:hypothetical protein